MFDKERFNKYFEANKDGWDRRTNVHKHSSFYDVSSFKAGKSSLRPIELQEVGNVKGKSLLHLQCHFGIDTLSWAREGARVTGIDISSEAITYAKELSQELSIPAHFICCNVYDLRSDLNQKYDIIFTSYGVTCWLPDLGEWASLINHFLKPRGIFYIIEFHPFLSMMDENFEFFKYPYHNSVVIAEKQSGTYADKTAPVEYEEYSWNHSLSEVINSLIASGLEIKHFNEFPFSCFNCFNQLVEGEDGYWRIKGLENKIPMMYSIKAIKPS